MTLKDIKKAVNITLKSKYPYPVYGVDTVEGYQRPSFFVYATETFSEYTKNAIHKNVDVEIDFIQTIPDESEAMEFFATMGKAFMPKLAVGKRRLNVDGIYSRFEDGNVPVFGFESEFWTAIEKPEETAPLMGEVIVRQEEK